MTDGLLECTGNCEGATGLPTRLENDPSTAHAAAVAAAALAVNSGNPAAALLDLLHLAMTRRLAAQEEV